MPGAAITIGVFDGVHRGHRELIRRVRDLADAGGLRALAVTFHPHPTTVVRPAATPLMLTTLDRRVALLRAAGLDDVEVVAFTTELSQLTPQQFVDDVLVGRLGVTDVVVGARFRFGHKAAGTVDTLRELGLRVDAVTPVSTPDGTAVSSTRIRAQVASGDVAAAAELLLRPHVVEGPVVWGESRGRQLGYPTANVRIADGIAVPLDGVYAGWLVRADGQRLPAAISVGTNPTFDGVARTVEAYAMGVGHDLDLYDEHVAVEFTQRLRGQERFVDVAALVAQMDRDVEAANRALGYT